VERKWLNLNEEIATKQTHGCSEIAERIGQTEETLWM
jgi:hypothetical protein